MPSRLATLAATAAAMLPAVPAQAQRGPEFHVPPSREALVQQCVGQIGHSTVFVSVQTDSFSYQPDITRLNVTEQATEDDIKSGDGHTVSVDASVNTLKQGLCYGYVDTHTAQPTAEAKRGDGNNTVLDIGIGGMVLAFVVITGSGIVVAERNRSKSVTNDQTNSHS